MDGDDHRIAALGIVLLGKQQPPLDLVRVALPMHAPGFAPAGLAARVRVGDGTPLPDRTRPDLWWLLKAAPDQGKRLAVPRRRDARDALGPVPELGRAPADIHLLKARAAANELCEK